MVLPLYQIGRAGNHAAVPIAPWTAGSPFTARCRAIRATLAADGMAKQMGATALALPPGWFRILAGRIRIFTFFRDAAL